MKVAAGFRILVLGVGIAASTGCGGDDDGPGMPFGLGGTGATEAVAAENVEFFDDFSGSFPPPNWIRREGNPFTSPNVGNAPPGLALLSFGKTVRVRGQHKFSTSEPLILSFDLTNPEVQVNSRFKFTVRPVDDDGARASFEIRRADDVLRVKIGSSDEDLPLTPFSSYRKVEFSVDSAATAHLWLDGQELLSGAGWPGGLHRIEFEVTGGKPTKFVVDNVKIVRP